MWGPTAAWSEALPVELDSTIERLRVEGRLLEAAGACLRAAEPSRAADLYEEACAFGPAAEAARLAGDHARAMRLAVLAGDVALARAVSSWVIEDAPEERVRTIAADLLGRGYPRYAGVLYRGLGDDLPAAEAFERAGRAFDAASCYDAADKPAAAARLLEAALRDPAEDEEPGRLRVMLGQLYARHGKHEAAVRALQRLPDGSGWRRDGLLTLYRALRQLGLEQAVRDLEPELRRAGVDANEAPRDAAAELPEGAKTVLYGRYRVEGEVAVTPHARVLEAVDLITDTRVAVKVLAARARGGGRDALARFVRESRTLTRLRHPNVLALHEFVPSGPALVLPWMTGGSLRDLLARESLSPARAAEIGGAVLAALTEAHRHGILHRDVKPSNLLFDDGGTAHLADFGAAHLSESQATVTVGAIGTVAYMSPEQREGRAATARSDVYCAGALLYEMLTGALPPAAGEPRVSDAHPDLDERHDRLLARLLEPLPERRFDSAQAARDALLALSWPARVVEHQRRNPSTAPPPAETAERLACDPDGRCLDTWIDRPVEVWPLDDDTLSRAAPIARAGHPALCTVLRVDAQARQVWLEAPPGLVLREHKPWPSLSDGERIRLRQALDALHQSGGVHGAVDASHVYRHAGTVYLAHPRALPDGASAEADLAALESLCL